MNNLIKRQYRSGLLRLQSRRNSAAQRPCFTLVELLIVIALIAVLVSMTMAAMGSAIEEAKVARTRSQINKLNELIMARWESYRTRAVRVIRVPGDTPRTLAQRRLSAVRELQRMELPDRITDVVTPPVILAMYPSVTRQYRVAAASANGAGVGGDGQWGVAGFDDDGNGIVDDISDYSPLSSDDVLGWTVAHQWSECLYLILAAMRDGGTTGIDFLFESEIADTDGDGMLEVLDAWGQPIQFLRWAPGFSEHRGPDGGWGVAGMDDDNDGIIDNSSEAYWSGSDDFPSPSELQTRNATKAPDIFDPLKVDPRWKLPSNSPPPGFEPFTLYPLIFSAGRDFQYGINLDALDSSGVSIVYASLSPIPNDPYFDSNYPTLAGSASELIGTPIDQNVYGTIDSTDNIHNHFLNTRTE